MKIFRLSGGLGNQFFSYAACYQYCRDHNEPIVLDTSTQEAEWFFRDFDLSHYNIRIDKKICYRLGDAWYDHLLLNHLFRRKAIGIFTPTIYQQRGGFHPETFDDLPNTCYMIGDWQYLGYFERYSDELRELFTYKEKLSSGAELMKSKIDKANCSVAIHARRGDKALMGAVLEGQYFIEAVNQAAETLGQSQISFFCFSEDTDWLRRTFVGVEKKYNFVYMDYESDNKGLEDFELMRHCKHQIISDSTYSYWAAYLNSNHDKKVFYQRNRRKGYWPEEWIPVIRENV